MTFPKAKPFVFSTIVWMAMLGANGSAAAAIEADIGACSKLERRLDARLLRGRSHCLRVAADREVRGRAFDATACEDRLRVRQERRRRAAGCIDDEQSARIADLRPRGEMVRGPVVVDGAVQVLDYERVDGRAIVEGDIILDIAEPGSEDVSHGDVARVALRSATSPTMRWPTLVVPYVIAPGFSATMEGRIAEAVAHWNAATMLYLKPRASEATYLTIRPSGDFYTCGTVLFADSIMLSPYCSPGAVIHEIGHAVGLWHEHSRQDRNTYVVVYPENAYPYALPQLAQYAAGQGVDRGLFDFDSIMLYDSYAGSKNGLATMTKRDGSTFTGQRTGLSRGDIAGVSLMATEGTSPRRLRNDATGRCLSLSYGTTYAVQVSCAYADRWRWFQHPVTRNRHLVNVRTGDCLYAPSSTTGTTLTPVACRNITRQSFVDDVSSRDVTSYHRIRNAGTGLCIYATTASSTVRQTACDSRNINQTWVEIAG